MHVIIRSVKSVLMPIKRLKSGALVRGEKPKDGYWEVVWKRKRGGVKDVSGILTKREAQKLADILNALSGRQASLLVVSLHSAGAAAQRERQRGDQLYSGRFFSRN